MWVSQALTDKGNVRSGNEDAFLCRDDIGLWVVADGMGGLDAGEMASEAVINALWNIPGNSNLEQMLEYVATTAEAVNRSLHAKKALLPAEHSLGTTLAALLISGKQGAVIWAGDSRIYRLRNGKLQQLTHDHSMVQDLVDQGLVHPAQAHNHPQSNVITRAIGVDDSLELEQQRFNVEANDIFLLCSDGLSNEVNDNELRALLSIAELNDATEQLLQLTLSRKAKDNVTIVTVGQK